MLLLQGTVYGLDLVILIHQPVGGHRHEQLLGCCPDNSRGEHQVNLEMRKDNHTNFCDIV